MLDGLSEFAAVGRGAMGVVWRARDERGRAFAIKTLIPGAEAPIADALELEAQALARLNHVGIVSLLEYGIARGHAVLAEETPYLVTEFCSGGTLTRPAAQLRDWANLRRMLAEILAALAHAHAHDVLHRDLKPANILISTATDDRPGLKVADFGLASLGDRIRVPMGTPAYMAPEQFDGASTLAPGADLYALGVIGWLFATGSLPFAGKGRELMLQKLRGSLPPFAPRFAVPAGVGPWLARLLSKNAHDRPASAAEALDQMPGARARRGLPSSHPLPPPPLREASSTVLPHRSVPLVGRERELRELLALLHGGLEGPRGWSVIGPRGAVHRFLAGAASVANEQLGARVAVLDPPTATEAVRALASRWLEVPSDDPEWSARVLDAIEDRFPQASAVIEAVGAWARAPDDPVPATWFARELVAAFAARGACLVSLRGGAGVGELARALAGVDGRIAVLTHARFDGSRVVELRDLSRSKLASLAAHVLPLSPAHAARLTAWARGDDERLIAYLSRCRVVRNEHGTFEIVDPLPARAVDAASIDPADRVPLARICWPDPPVRKDQLTIALGGAEVAARWEQRLRASGDLRADGRWWAVRSAWRDSVLAALDPGEVAAAARAWAGVLDDWSGVDPLTRLRAWVDAGDPVHPAALIDDAWGPLMQHGGAPFVLESIEAVLASRRRLGIEPSAAVEGRMWIRRQECLQHLGASPRELAAAAFERASVALAQDWPDVAATIGYLGAGMVEDIAQGYHQLGEWLVLARTPWTVGVIEEALAIRAHDLGWHELAGAHQARALEAFAQVPTRASARRQARIAGAQALRDGDLPAARQALERSLTLADDVHQRASILLSLGELTLLEDPERALAVLTECEGLLLQVNERMLLATVALNRAVGHLLLDDLDGARDLLARAAAVRNPQVEIWVTFIELVLMAREGRWKEVQLRLPPVRAFFGVRHAPDPMVPRLIELAIRTSNLPLGLRVDLEGLLALEREHAGRRA